MTVELPGVPVEVDSAQLVRQMVRRAASPGFNTWWAKVEDAGFCANPIHLAGTDELGREHRVFTRCNNRRAIVCPSCSDLYARDTWQLIHAGLHGGHHNIPTTVAQHPQVFVTLTAPSFGAVHTIRADGTCHPRNLRAGNCRHERRAWCEATHRHDDPALGQPLCGQCYDYVGHVLFSWHAPELWRRFTIRLRRLLSYELRIRAEDPKHTHISFMKIVELQRRGLPHFHAVIRLDAASERPSPPDTSVRVHEFVDLVRRAAADIELTAIDDRIIRFGEQLDIKVIGCGNVYTAENLFVSSRKVARYLAKYVTKSLADIGVGVRRFSAAAIESLDVSTHVREILRTIVDLASHELHEGMLSWIHTLGYRGHVMSKSRQFSTTMTALREHRAAWRKEQMGDTGSAITKNEISAPEQWEFARSGHVNLGDRVLAISAFGRARLQRLVARDALTAETWRLHADVARSVATQQDPDEQSHTRGVVN